jgi:glyoxylase-like metal-dependent hydrolase (beta-lactamase superfamily II)
LLVVGFPSGAFQANCYLLAPGEGAECVIVDPGQDSAGRIAAALREHGLSPAGVLATHGHFDHVASAGAVAEANGVAVRIHPADADLLEDRARAISLEEGVLELGGLRIGVEHTPGAHAGLGDLPARNG